MMLSPGIERAGRRCAGWLAVALSLFAGLHAVRGHIVTLSWNPSASPEVVGYQIVYGAEPGRYPFSKNVGNVTNAAVDLPDGISMYYLAAVAYDSNSVPSDPSPEVIYATATAVSRLGFTSADEIKVSWNSIPGKSYRVFYRPDLFAGSWTPVTGILTAQSAAMEWFAQIKPDAPSGFFMVQPIDPNVPPELQTTPLPYNMIRLSWNAIPGLGYRLYYTTNVSSDIWTPLTDVLIADSLLMEWTDTVDPASPRTYRIEVITNPVMLAPVQGTQFYYEYIMSWTSAPGVSYRILYKPYFPGGEWTPVSDVFTPEMTQGQISMNVNSSFPAGSFSVQAIPNSELSPTLKIAKASGNQLKLSWPSISGFGYRVLSRTNLSDNTWTPASDLLADSGASEWTAPIDPAAPFVFLKLEVDENPALPPQIFTTPTSYGTRMLWVSKPGFGYQVMYKTDPSVPDWTPVSGLLQAFYTLMEWNVPVDPTYPNEVYTVKCFAPPLPGY
jgi:hypothetical protein